LLAWCCLACAGTTARPAAVMFEPPSSERAAEIDRQVKQIVGTVSIDAFEAHTFQPSIGVSVPYRLLRPAGSGPHPLIVIFHGSGAIGDDNRSQIGPLARSWATADARERYPAFILVPQFSGRTANYTQQAGGLPHSEGTELLRAGLELVQHIRTTENIASGRVFALGFSMGGSALWNALHWSPGLFSRAIIVAGVPSGETPDLGATRVLLVHGDHDDENPFAAAWSAYLQSSAPLEFWRFRGLGHEFPQELIAGDRLQAWMFR
jgi:predicted peptidase